jgi:hypothetical protein
MRTEIKTIRVECDSCHTSMQIVIESDEIEYPIYGFTEINHLEDWNAELLGIPIGLLGPKLPIELCDSCLKKIRK